MSDPEIRATILKYETFVNNVLREDLRVLEDRLTQINMQITDLVQEKHSLKVVTDKTKHPEGYKTQVNLGQNFFMEATVPDTSTMLVNIGLNHYLEFSEAEANKYLDSVIKAHEANAEQLRTKAAETKAHIKLILMGLDALVHHNQEES